MESDDSDGDHRNGHSSDEDGRAGSGPDVATGDDDPPLISKDGPNGTSKEKEETEESEPDHSDDDNDGEMDQSECSSSELVDSMEQDSSGQSNTT